MKAILLALSLIVTSACAAAPEFSDVFTAGRDAYRSLRIPAVVVATNGHVLAFAEGRAARADQAQNDIVLKRSFDGGKTWGALQVIADDGAQSLNNPTAVVEQNSGRVFGILNCLQSACACQKHPCTKITVLYRVSTISGLPGNCFPCKRYRNPLAHKKCRTRNSGRVSRLLMRAMSSPRVSAFLMSATDEIREE